jgi:hypothetical protein
MACWYGWLVGIPQLNKFARMPPIWGMWAGLLVWLAGWMLGYRKSPRESCCRELGFAPLSRGPLQQALGLSRHPLLGLLALFSWSWLRALGVALLVLNEQPQLADPCASMQTEYTLNKAAAGA